jgi:hypothetical protein
MGFRLAPWPRAFKFVGDSHAARFDGLVFHDDDRTHFIATQAHNHYGFRATEFSYDDGSLNERLVRSLLTLNLLRGTRVNAIPALGSFRTARAPLGWEFGLRVRQSYRDELLVISCGEVDARDIIRRLPLDARIATAQPIARFPDDPSPAAAAISEAELAAEIEAEYLAPLFRGLQTLHAIGIGNLFLLALPPPGLNDDDYAAHCGFASRRHVRYAVHRTINACYERFCRATGIEFIDTWPLVTAPDGALRPDFGSDSVHLNRDAAVAIVADVAQRAARAPAPPPDPLV